MQRGECQYLTGIFNELQLTECKYLTGIFNELQLTECKYPTGLFNELQLTAAIASVKKAEGGCACFSQERL